MNWALAGLAGSPARRLYPETQAISAARGFAQAAHFKQIRKYTLDTPYFNHLKEVAHILHGFDCDEQTICAGYLHDVIEDTEVTADYLRRYFDKRVVDMVLEVSDVTTLKDGNRAKRKEIERAHIARCSPQGANVKMADICSNSQDIVQNDRNFARVYLPEMKLTLDLLSHGNVALHVHTRTVLENSFNEIFGVGNEKSYHQTT